MRHALRGRATRSTGLPRSDLGVAYATARRALAPPARAAVAVGSLPRPAPSALTCENGRAAGGKVYLAVVLDAWSRMVIGWSIADHIRSGLVVDALQMAIWRRRPAQGKTICHTDHGSQYTSWAFGRRLRAAGLLGSRGSIGDCFDNSLAESFFGTLQLELLDRSPLGDEGPAGLGDLRLRGGLLQSAPPALLDRELQSRRVRVPPHSRR